MKARGEGWYIGDTVVVGIGQGLLSITPLQLAEGVATIANRGKRFKPHLLLKSITTIGKTIPNPPIAKPPILLHNENNWNIVIHAMQDVVNAPWGTAHYFQKPPNISVAGKTGTAQVSSSRHISENKNAIPKQFRDNHLFIAFAPVDHPEIALALIVEHAAISTQVASEIVNDYFRRYHPEIYPKETEEDQQDTQEEEQTEGQEAVDMRTESAESESDHTPPSDNVSREAE